MTNEKIQKFLFQKHNNPQLLIAVMVTSSILTFMVIFASILKPNDTSNRTTLAVSNTSGLSTRPLFKEVLAFYPYFVDQTLYNSIPLEDLSIISWASLPINSNGSLGTRTNYPPTQMITGVHAKGVKITLSIGTSTAATINNILGNSTAQTAFIDNVFTAVQANNFDGIDIDFEGVPSTNSVTGTPNKALMVSFMQNLSVKFWNSNPAYIITLDLPDYDWNKTECGGAGAVWDVANLQNYVTFMNIMGYDIWYETSSDAGPTAPLDSDYPTDPCDPSIRKSVTTYLAEGANKNKLLLLVPWYGFEWPTVSNARKAKTTGPSPDYFSYTYLADKAATYGRLWDPVWKVPHYSYQVGSQWYQGYYDDSESLGLKYDLALQEDIAGTGIWALGYDTRNELWAPIDSKFTDRIIPQVSLNSPSDNDTVSGNISIDVNATDNRQVAGVKIYLDDVEKTNLTSSPYTFSLDTTTVADGIHTLKARAEDGVGNWAEQTISININNSSSTPTSTPTPIQTPTPTPGNLAAYWKLDEASGVTANDFSGNSNNGTLSGATWAAGKVNNGLSFDGINDYMSAVNSASLNITNALTVEAWVKLNQLPSERATKPMYILNKGDAPGTTLNRGYNLYDYYGATTADNDKVRFDIFDSNGNLSRTKSNVLSKNQWYHIAGVYTSGFQGIYVNGVLVNSIANPVALATDSKALSLGSYQNSNHFLNGVVDEVKIYSRALTASEVLADYNAGGPTPTPTLTSSPTPTATPTPTNTPVPTPTNTPIPTVTPIPSPTTPISTPTPTPTITSLGSAVDNTALTFTTGGTTNWFAENRTYYFGGSAAQSGKIDNYKSSYIQTTVTGPGTLKFWWKVSSERYGDYLRFYIDGTQKNNITGSVGWQQKIYSITSGIHTLKWNYVKDIGVAKGSDAGWIDKVEYVQN